MQIDIVGDGLQKVGFAQSRSAVYVQGVEIRRGVFGDRLRRREHEIVALARHERIEGIARVQIARNVVVIVEIFHARKHHVVLALDHQLEIGDARVRFADGAFHGVGEFRSDIVREKFGVRFQYDLSLFDIHGNEFGNVHLVGDGGDHFLHNSLYLFP